jgi:site-specific DNA recombinase
MAQTVGVYCRISKDDGAGQGLGVRRQEKDCRALAERKGWTVAEVFIDNDRGAYHGKRRPAYERMLDALKSGTIDGLVVWHLDRLTRRPAELEVFFDMCDAAGVRSLATVTGDVDLGTDDGRFLARVVGAAARKESDDHARRKRAKHAELAQDGKPVGGFRPYGYSKGNGKLTIRQKEAARIRDAATCVLAGDSVRAIAGDWNRRGFRGPRGGRWTQHTLTRVLQHPRLAGLRTLHGEIIGQGQWEPILDRPTWERVCATLESRHTRTGFGARRYLLVGFLYCGKCRTRLISQPRSDRRRSYCCSSGPDKGGCGGVRTIAEPLEDVVVEAVMLAVDSPDLARIVTRQNKATDDNDDAAELERANAKLSELSRLWARDKISRAEWIDARKVVEQRADAAQRRIAARTDHGVLRAYAGHSGALRTAWPSLSLDRKRAVLSALLDRIIVNPAKHPHGGRFDPDRIDLAWRV